MSSNMIARQQPSTMPVSRYRPYAEQFSVALPDRRWPSQQITTAPRRLPGPPDVPHPGKQPNGSDLAWRPARTS